MTRNMCVEQCGTVTNEEGKRGRYISPAVDISEEAGSFTLTADLPGVGKDGLDINVEAGVLTIEGAITEEYLARDGLFADAGYTGYRRTFKLGEQLDQEKINAELNHGVLTLTLPQAAAAKSQRIDVSVH